MVEKNTTTNKVKISNAGYLIFSKDIANRLVDNLIVQNIGLFSENKEFRLRIYQKETFFTLPYVEKICKSNQFIKKNNDMLRHLMHSIQGYEQYTSGGIKLHNKMLSTYTQGNLLEVIQYDNYIDIKEITF